MPIIAALVAIIALMIATYSLAQSVKTSRATDTLLAKLDEEN